MNIEIVSESNIVTDNRNRRGRFVTLWIPLEDAEVSMCRERKAMSGGVYHHCNKPKGHDGRHRWVL